MAFFIDLKKIVIAAAAILDARVITILRPMSKNKSGVTGVSR